MARGRCTVLQRTRASRALQCATRVCVYVFSEPVQTPVADLKQSPRGMALTIHPRVFTVCFLPRSRSLAFTFSPGLGRLCFIGETNLERARSLLYSGKLESNTGVRQYKHARAENFSSVALEFRISTDDKHTRGRCCRASAWITHMHIHAGARGAHLSRVAQPRDESERLRYIEFLYRSRNRSSPRCDKKEVLRALWSTNSPPRGCISYMRAFSRARTDISDASRADNFPWNLWLPRERSSADRRIGNMPLRIRARPGGIIINWSGQICFRYTRRWWCAQSIFRFYTSSPSWAVSISRARGQ